MSFLAGYLLFDQDLRVGWGKPVPKEKLNPMAMPVAVVVRLLHCMCVVISHNPQPPRKPDKDESDLSKFPKIEVALPEDRELTRMINKLAHHVAREGIIFEVLRT